MENFLSKSNFLLFSLLFAATASSKAQSYSPGCDAALKSADAEIAQKNKQPPLAGAVPAMERVMWATNLMISAIDGHCKGEPDALTLRKQLAESRKTAETSCNQLATKVCTDDSH